MNTRHTIRAARTTIRRGTPLTPSTALRLRWLSRRARHLTNAIITRATWHNIPPATLGYRGSASDAGYWATPSCPSCAGTGLVDAPDLGDESASWEYCGCYWDNRTCGR